VRMAGQYGCAGSSLVYGSHRDGCEHPGARCADNFDLIISGAAVRSCCSLRDITIALNVPDKQSAGVAAVVEALVTSSAPALPPML